MTPPGSWVVLRVMDMFLNYIVAMGWWFYDTRKVPNATELDFEMADLILCEMHPILLLFFFFSQKRTCLFNSGQLPEPSPPGPAFRFLPRPTPSPARPPCSLTSVPFPGLSPKATLNSQKPTHPSWLPLQGPLRLRDAL